MYCDWGGPNPTGSTADRKSSVAFFSQRPPSSRFAFTAKKDQDSAFLSLQRTPAVTQTAIE